ncbi:MAG: hypothetical protein MMC33_004539 [Icmadophila ericetorum]|nr:hypothetical protein [Icmadophila ericetorum]
MLPTSSRKWDCKLDNKTTVEMHDLRNVHTSRNFQHSYNVRINWPAIPMPTGIWKVFNRGALEGYFENSHRADIELFRNLAIPDAHETFWDQHILSFSGKVDAVRILICGNTGVGKSTIINRVFGVALKTQESGIRQGQHDINRALQTPEDPRSVSIQLRVVSAILIPNKLSDWYQKWATLVPIVVIGTKKDKCLNQLREDSFKEAEFQERKSLIERELKAIPRSRFEAAHNRAKLAAEAIVQKHRERRESSADVEQPDGLEETESAHDHFEDVKETFTETPNSLTLEPMESLEGHGEEHSKSEETLPSSSTQHAPQSSQPDKGSSTIQSRSK